MRAAFRTLATLTPLAWGFLLLVVFPVHAYAVDYSWTSYLQISRATGFSSPSAACQSLLSICDTADGSTSKPSGLSSVIEIPGTNGTGYYCEFSFLDRGDYVSGNYQWNDNGRKSHYCGSGNVAKADRVGDSCPSGSVYNAQTGQCDAPPEPCPTTDIYAAVSCAYIAGAGWVCPGEVCRDSCAYVTSPNSTSKCDSALGACRARYSGSGSSCSVGSEQCSGATCVDAPSPSEPPPVEPPCTTYQGTTVCISNDNTGCGTVNGVEGCFTPDQNCGTYNGTFSCFPQDKPQNNCGYANGQKVCFDPNNPTQQIPPTSADHPNNGGNADGNDNNDPMNPSETSGTSPQGSNQGATNESVDDLGEKLGEKIDRTNSLLDGIDGVLDGIKGLLDDEYNASAESSDAEAGAAGTAAGQAMGQSVGTAVDDAVAARDAEVEQAIGAVPSTVDAFFGPSGELVPALNSLGGFFPEASSCSDYTIPINAMGVSIQVTLPVCFLSRFTSLIEWVLWCLTAIGLWNIFYSGLRLENAKASKGGF